MARPQAALEALLTATAAGDRGAFARLYEASAGKLFSVCLAVLGNRALAEEALQDAYMNVWRKASTFDAAKGTAMTWLITIARYRALTLRSRAGRETPADIDAYVDRLVDPAPGPQADAVQASERHALLTCLDTLEAKPREAMLFVYFKGFTQDELAKRMDVPLGTVKSWIRRSLVRLRTCLDDG